MKKLLTICAAAMIAFATSVAYAPPVLDVDTIIMTSCKSHPNGIPSTPNPWCFEVWVELDDPGTLDHINMTLPDGTTTYPLHIDNGDCDWEYDSNNYSSLDDLQDDYPTGSYAFDFLSDTNGSLLTFGLDYSGLYEPCSPVDFTSPTHLATDVPLDPTFEWLVDSGDGDALYMWLDNDDCYENGPVSMDTLDWTPGSLDPNDYSLEVSVINVKGLLEEGPAFPTMTVGIDEFKYGLWIEHLNEIEFTTVPEPATICLLGLGGLSLLRRKRSV